MQVYGRTLSPRRVEEVRRVQSLWSELFPTQPLGDDSAIHLLLLAGGDIPLITTVMHSAVKASSYPWMYTSGTLTAIYDGRMMEPLIPVSKQPMKVSEPTYSHATSLFPVTTVDKKPPVKTKQPAKYAAFVKLVQQSPGQTTDYYAQAIGVSHGTAHTWLKSIKGVS